MGIRFGQFLQIFCEMIQFIFIWQYNTNSLRVTEKASQWSAIFQVIMIVCTANLCRCCVIVEFWFSGLVVYNDIFAANSLRYHWWYRAHPGQVCIDTDIAVAISMDKVGQGFASGQWLWFCVWCVVNLFDCVIEFICVNFDLFTSVACSYSANTIEIIWIFKHTSSAVENLSKWSSKAMLWLLLVMVMVQVV